MSESIDGAESVRFSVTPDTLRRMGTRAVQIIRTRTQSGIDADGQAFMGYSTKPFAMPIGAVGHTALAILKSEKAVHFWEKDGVKKWVTIEGGYTVFKAARYPQYAGAVNLQATGNMLRALTITTISADTVSIGFTRADEARKAYYNIFGRHPRNFMGLTAQERDEIGKIAIDGLQVAT